MWVLLFLLAVAAFVAKYWPWLLLSALTYAVFRHVARSVRATEDARAALIARADHQHAQCMAGNDDGVYGLFPPPDAVRF